MTPEWAWGSRNPQIPSHYLYVGLSTREESLKFLSSSQRSRGPQKAEPAPHPTPREISPAHSLVPALALILGDINPEPALWARPPIRAQMAQVCRVPGAGPILLKCQGPARAPTRGSKLNPGPGSWGGQGTGPRSRGVVRDGLRWKGTNLLSSCPPRSLWDLGFGGIVKSPAIVNSPSKGVIKGSKDKSHRKSKRTVVPTGCCRMGGPSTGTQGHLGEQPSTAAQGRISPASFHVGG